MTSRVATRSNSVPRVSLALAQRSAFLAVKAWTFAIVSPKEKPPDGGQIPTSPATPYGCKVRGMTEQSAHFAFGENWQSFAQIVTEQSIEKAQADLLRLFPNGELVGKPFFDIGCGSGLSMLAALRLGASEAIGIDVDANSVAAARSLLLKFANQNKWRVEQKSVFDLDPERDGRMPVVYSWGVLHHTGNMRKAVEVAASMVAPGGTLAIALYRRTMLCPVWRIEKRMYSGSGRAVQLAVSSVYKAAFISALVLLGRNPFAYVRDYRTKRGMDWSHDIRDWLGGFPYESADSSEIISQLESLGFSTRPAPRQGRSIGLFSSGCDEYIAVKSYNDGTHRPSTR